MNDEKCMASCRRRLLKNDGEPAPKGFLKAVVLEQSGEEFFNSKEYLTRYNNTSKSKRHKIPGHAYFNIVESFFELHYERGELYFEFLKGDCARKGELSLSCKGNACVDKCRFNKSHTTSLPGCHTTPLLSLSPCR